MPNEISMLVTLAEREDTWLFPRWFQIAADVAVALGVAGSVVAIIYGRTHPNFALVPNLLAYIGCWFTLFLAVQCIHGEYHSSRYSERVRGSLRQIVIESQNPDIFPVIMRMLLMGAYTQQDEVTASDKALHEAAGRWLRVLSVEQIRAYAIRHQALYQFLVPFRAFKTVELTLRILHILEQIGTGSAISVVKSLVDDRTFFHKPKQVKDAAQACLNILMEREKQIRQPETLLRASCAPDTGLNALLRATSAPLPAPETLLRPLATQVPAAAPEQLLRSANNEE